MNKIFDIIIKNINNVKSKIKDIELEKMQLSGKIIENKQDNMSDQTADFLLNNAKLALRALKAVKSEDQEYYYDACEELSNRRNDWDYIITQLETKMIPYLN